MWTDNILNKIKYGTNLNKPQYMLRLIHNLGARYLLKQRPLRGIDFAVDFACNLRCEHCFNKDILSGRQKMGLEDYRRVFREAEKEGILNFCFQGGEFLVLDCWQDILALLNPKKFSLSVTTNGTTLTKAKARRLKELGVNTITISIDSGIPEEHDAFRGVPGTFKRAMAGVENARSEGMKVAINSTITPESMRSEGFTKLVEFASTNNLLLNTIFAAPSGNWSGCQNIIMREGDIAEYEAMRKEYGNIVRDTESLFVGSGCPGVMESLYISPFGDVYGCAYIHIRLGNIFEEPLRDIRKKGMKYFRYSKKCLIAEKTEFIQEYLDLVNGQTLPLPFEAHEAIKSW